MSALDFTMHLLFVLFIASWALASASPTPEISTQTSISSTGNNNNNKDCNCDTQTSLSIHRSPAQNILIHGMSCACSLVHRAPAIRDDYHYEPTVGAHKLHTRASTWNQARKLCNDEGAHLAIINSKLEAQALLDLFNRSGPIKGASYPNEAFLGIHDLYAEGEWVTVQGEPIGKTGYNTWSDKWGGQPDNGGGRQNCGALMKEGGLDDVACDVPFPFFCELPTMQFF